MRVAIAAMMGPALIYLFSAFVAWEPNPAEWSEGTRFFTALLGLGFAGLFGTFAWAQENKA